MARLLEAKLQGDQTTVDQLERRPLENRERRQLIGRMVRDPLTYLDTNRLKGKSCLDCVIFLQTLRQEIQADSSFAIDDPHPIYARFHRLSNGSVEHHIALFTLLKDAGFNRNDVKGAIMDLLPVAEAGEGPKITSRGDIVRAYLRLTTKALDAVFGQRATGFATSAAAKDRWLSRGRC